MLTRALYGRVPNALKGMLAGALRKLFSNEKTSEFDAAAMTSLAHLLSVSSALPSSCFIPAGSARLQLLLSPALE